MSTLITVLHVIVCLFLMLTVLLQSGKGGGMGAAFGGSSAGTVFGGSGASGFLKRLTAIAGTVFMMTSIVLAYLSSKGSADSLDSFGKEQEEISEQKEKAKTSVLKRAKQLNTGSGSATTPAGSGSAGGSTMTPLTPVTPGSATPTPAEKPAPAGSAATPTPAPAGSATPAPAAGNAATPTPAGSATKTPAPAPAGSAAKPAAGSGK